MDRKIQLSTSWPLYGLATGLMATLAQVDPLVQFIFTLFWSVPIVYVIKKEGLLQGLMALGIAWVMLFFSKVGIFNATIVVSQIGIMSMVLGVAFIKNIPGKQTLMTLILVTIILQLISYGITYPTVHGHLAEMRSNMESTLEESLDIYREQGLLPPDDVREAEVKDLMKNSFNFIIDVFPATMIFISFMSSIGNYFFSLWYLRRNYFDLGNQVKVFEFALPWYSIWIMILGLSFILVPIDNALLTLIGKNLIALYVAISLYIGLLIVWRFLSRWKTRRFLKVLVIFALVFNMYFTLILLALFGMFDPVFNFRKLGRDEKDQKK
jgi:hypothetical protein